MKDVFQTVIKYTIIITDIIKVKWVQLVQISLIFNPSWRLVFNIVSPIKYQKIHSDSWTVWPLFIYKQLSNAPSLLGLPLIAQYFIVITGLAFIQIPPVFKIISQRIKPMHLWGKICSSNLCGWILSQNFHFDKKLFFFYVFKLSSLFLKMFLKMSVCLGIEQACD